MRDARPEGSPYPKAKKAVGRGRTENHPAPSRRFMVTGDNEQRPGRVPGGKAHERVGRMPTFQPVLASRKAHRRTAGRCGIGDESRGAGGEDVILPRRSILP